MIRASVIRAVAISLGIVAVILASYGDPFARGFIVGAAAVIGALAVLVAVGVRE